MPTVSPLFRSGVSFVSPSWPIISLNMEVFSFLSLASYRSSQSLFPSLGLGADGCPNCASQASPGP